MSIVCRDCKYWGGNNGKVVSSTNDSKCLKLRRKVNAMNYCNSFELRQVSKQRR